MMRQLFRVGFYIIFTASHFVAASSSFALNSVPVCKINPDVSVCATCKDKTKSAAPINGSGTGKINIDPGWSGACPPGSGKKPPCNADDWLAHHKNSACAAARRILMESSNLLDCPDSGGSCSLEQCTKTGSVICTPGTCQNPSSKPDKCNISLDGGKVISPTWTQYTYTISSLSVICSYTCVSNVGGGTGGIKIGDPVAVGQTTY